MDINAAFGKALREMRLKRGVSQDNLPKAASRVYVSMLERGLRSPTLSTVDKISEELGVHPLALLLLTYKYKDGMDLKSLRELLKSI